MTEEETGTDEEEEREREREIERDADTQETSSTEVGFIFQLPAIKGTRAISSEREAVRAERGAALLAARSAAPLPIARGMPAGGGIEGRHRRRSGRRHHQDPLEVRHFVRSPLLMYGQQDCTVNLYVIYLYSTRQLIFCALRPHC